MKKVFITVLIICLLIGTMGMSVFAASFPAGAYVRKINANGALTADNIRAAVKGTDFDAIVTVTPKSSITLNGGTTTVTADNVDQMFSFKRGTTTVTFSGVLSTYFDVSGVISGDVATATFSDKTANATTMYLVLAAIDNYDSDVSAKVMAEHHSRYTLEGSGTYTAMISKWNTSVCSLGVGSRLYASGGEYDMENIAVVQATVRRQNGSVVTYEYSAANVITGLLPGEEVYLKARLMNEADSEYYMFNGWVDGNGHMVANYDTIAVIMEGRSVSVFASYVPVKPHIKISANSMKMTYKQVDQLESFPDAIRWESSNPRAVRVDADSGIIEAVGAGKATITAYSADGATATCEVTVRYTFVQILIRIFLLGFIWY